MSGDTGTGRAPTPFERARDIDAWCDRFEADWRIGRRPRVEDYLAGVPAPLRAEMRSELTALETALRRELGALTTSVEPWSPPSDTAPALDPGEGGPSGSGATTLPERSAMDRETLAVEPATDFGPPGALDGALTQATDPDESLVARRRPVLEQLADALLGRPGGSEATLTIPASGGSMPEQGPDIGVTPRFRILRPHARGGLGEVFLARDEPLRREVAIKELQRGLARRPDCRARFLREAELTGVLEHPGIVPVYALGEHQDGRPFYAMRFIRGETLQEAAARIHDPAAAPGDPRARTLALRSLLRRFVDVCNAIAYAHSRGIIHRDLKPANIMLGPFGEALVLDWGLAKPLGAPDGDSSADDGAAAGCPAPAIGSGSETRPGATLGTPRYMSPEQAAGDVERIGPPSDIYGLGSTLYHLLTGRAPFDGSDVAAIIDRVRRGDFPPPCRINPEVPPALESICLKAMARDPEDRYPTVRALADDMERWLDDEAVTAHRDGIAARLARWARRHRPAVVGAAALLLTATLALAIGTVLIGREAARREAQRRLAVRNFAMARDAVDRMLSRVGEVELAEVPQMVTVRRPLLEEALHFYEEFTRRRSDDPDLRLELGRSRIRLARVQELLGDPNTAEPHYRQAIAELRPLAIAGPAGAAARADLARARDGLGMLLKRANRFREAETELRAALRLREELSREVPGDPERRRELAEGRYHLGALLARTRDRGAEDERAYLAAVALQRGLVAAARGRAELQTDLARSLNNLGLLLAADGRTEEALDAFREAASLLDDPVGHRPAPAGRRWQRARALSNLGVLLRADGGSAQAETALGQARALLDDLAADFPAVPDYRRDLASVHNNLGLLHASLNRRAAAEAAYAEAIRLQEELVADSAAAIPDDRQRLATTRLNRGVLRIESDSDAAEADLREAVAAHRRLLEAGPEVPEYQATLGTALAALGRSQWRQDEPDQARRSLEQAIEHHRAALASLGDRDVRARLHADHGMLALVLEGLGDHVGMAGAAEQLPGLFPDRGDDYLRAAAFLVRCAELAADDPTLAAAERSVRRQSYLTRAVDWLRRASDRGLIADPADLDRPEFAPLYGREDFAALLSAPSPKTPPSRPR